MGCNISPQPEVVAELDVSAADQGMCEDTDAREDDPRGDGNKILLALRPQEAKGSSVGDFESKTDASPDETDVRGHVAEKVPETLQKLVSAERQVSAESFCCSIDEGPFDGAADHQVSITSAFSDGAKPGGKVIRKDLTIKGILGCGSFAVVELVEHNETKETFALKTISKSHAAILKRHSAPNDEKKAQFMCDSPFIIKLYETFIDYENLYFLMELSLGGEVLQTYKDKGFFGSVRHTQFYIAGVVYALEHLHGRNIVFGDVKPANMLITGEGRVKLCDFGVAQVLKKKGDTTSTRLSPHEYAAPEVLEGDGFACAADWWSLGVSTFLLMTASLPFLSWRIIPKGCDKVEFPAEIRGSCEDFVRGLLKINESERLPMRQGGIENLQTHEWFQNFEWDAVWNMTLEPPYKPTGTHSTDMSNFRKREEEDKPCKGLEFKNYDDAKHMYLYTKFATSD